MSIQKYLYPVELIAEVELPDRGGFTKQLPQFQNNLGSCGFMATALAVSRIFGFPVSTLWIMILAKFYEDSFDVEGVRSFDALVYVVCAIGVIPEWMLPYSDEIDWSDKDKLLNMLTNDMHAVASQYRVKGAIPLTTSRQICRALAVKYPVIWGATISKDFRFDEDGYVLLYGRPIGAHAMFKFAYDLRRIYKFEEYDTPDRGFIDFMQTWKIGDNPWGDDGVGHISCRALDDEIIVDPNKAGFKLWNECYAFVPYEEDYKKMINPLRTVVFSIFDNAYTIDGTKHYLDSSPFIRDGRTMIPIRAISEGLDFDVDWNAETQEIIIENPRGKIKLKVGSKDIYYRSVVQKLDWIKSELQMDVPVVIYNSRAYIPLRFVAEMMSCLVHWDPVNRSVTVEQYQ